MQVLELNERSRSAGLAPHSHRLPISIFLQRLIRNPDRAPTEPEALMAELSRRAKPVDQSGADAQFLGGFSYGQHHRLACCNGNQSQSPRQFAVPDTLAFLATPSPRHHEALANGP